MDHVAPLPQDTRHYGRRDPDSPTGRRVSWRQGQGSGVLDAQLVSRTPYRQLPVHLDDRTVQVIDDEVQGTEFASSKMC
jgi:hypothetical protein